MRPIVSLISIVCQILAIWFAWQHSVLGLAISLTVIISMAVGLALGKDSKWLTFHPAYNLLKEENDWRWNFKESDWKSH